ncbi:endonuclease domain-containing protein [Paenibacillus sp. GCM10027628]|uniref:endonuclease domain-containing protein n=1 Tax=Paenibacillus sp. GCM10027628 TaxID=3273413 RepID=UPI00363F2AE7
MYIWIRSKNCTGYSCNNISLLEKGERLRRLKEGHGHAEKLFLQQVWWKAFDDFQDLHPEYEVRDFRDGYRYIDFAFIRHSLRLAIEIDGYGTHSAHISRSQFSDQWMRQNHLIIDGWKVLRFTYDDVKDRPRMCEQILQQFMGRYFGDTQQQVVEMNYIEKEICRFTQTIDRFLTPRDVCEKFGFGQKKARRILLAMAEKRLLLPAGAGQKRIKCYKLHPAVAAKLVNS